MTKSTTTMSALSNSSGRGQKRLRLTISQVVKAIKKLGNERGYSFTSIRNRLYRDVGKFSNDQINSALQRAVKAGRVKEITEDRFSLLRNINQPASQASSIAASQASTIRESRGRPSDSCTTTSKRRNRSGFVLRLVEDMPTKRSRRVLPTNQLSGRAARTKNRQRRQQKQQQHRRQRCMHKDNLPAEDDDSRNRQRRQENYRRPRCLRNGNSRNRSGRVLPTNQQSRHAARSKNRQRRQQQPKYKRLQQYRGQRSMRKEAVAACDDFSAEDDPDSEAFGADD